MFAQQTMLALALLASASATEHTADAVAQQYQWEAFKAEYGKAYATQGEEDTRYGNFVAFLQAVDARNAAETGSASHGITKFADLSAAEFQQRYLNYVPSVNERSRTMAEGIEALPEGTDAVADWTGTYTTPVKDQGACGSCWAFSATEQIESDYMRAGNNQTILSPQQVTSCTKYVFGGGCNGGYTENAFKYAEAGLETEASYPYTSGASGVTGSCQSNASQVVVKVASAGYTTVSASATDEPQMAAYVGAAGPLSVCVDAETWSSYTGGVLATCGTELDHCVQVVGVDTSANGSYWKVRNSWGTGWGEAGFIRLAYGNNTCAVASDANYATTASA